MKATVFVLIATAVSLAAQVPAPSPAPAPVTPAAPAPGPFTPGDPVVPGPGPTRDATAQRLNAAAQAAARKPLPSVAGPAAKPAAPAPNVVTPPAPAPANPAVAALPAAAPADTAIVPGKALTPAVQMVPPGLLKLKKADADQVLEIYADLVNKTILRSATLPTPQITFMAETELTVPEAIAALDDVLNMNGIAIIPFGEKFVKAVPTANAPQVGGFIHEGTAKDLPELGQYVTHVVQLKFAKPSEMQQALTSFASTAPNPLLAIDTSMILIIRDFAENVKRMLELVDKIDVKIPDEFISDVIPIKYAMASDIAGALNSLSSGGGGTTVGGGTGMGTGSGMGRGSMGRSSGFGGSRTGMGSGYGGGMGMGSGYGGGMSPYGTTVPLGTTAPGAPGAAGGANASFTDRIRGIIGRSGQGGTGANGDIQIIGLTKIIADERTNSLLIYATRDDMKTIRKIIDQLDVVLSQVLIEAVIMEVTVDDSSNIGVSAAQNPNNPSNWGKQVQGLGMMNNGNNLGWNTFSGLTNATASAAPGGMSYLGTIGNSLEVTVNALQSRSKSRILQRPRIQTSHAVQAQLFVGQSRPYPTGSYYGGGAYGGYSSIQQMQIGVNIDVTPLINPDGLVVMDIHTKIDSVAGSVTIANVGDVPVTSSKEASAKVAVRDHDTIMLGGLIDTTKSYSDTGIPVLKDIPLLGALFRSSNKDDSRDELIILIRPTVLPTPEVAALAARAERSTMPGIRGAVQEFMRDEKAKVRETEKSFKGREELELK